MTHDPFLTYDLPDEAHPECPMWVRLPHGQGWLRPVDDANIVRHGPGWILRFTAEKDHKPIQLHVRTVAGHDKNGKPNEVQYDDAAGLAYVDREHPPAAPPVRIGQVWIIPEDPDDVGVAEFAIDKILRFKGGSSRVILPTIEEDGTIRHIAVAWDLPPEDAVMVRDFDGPKVWTPPGWVRPTGAEEEPPTPAWRHLPDAQCADCESDAVQILTISPSGYAHNGDEVKCDNCGCRGVVFEGGLVWSGKAP